MIKLKKILQSKYTIVIIIVLTIIIDISSSKLKLNIPNIPLEGKIKSIKIDHNKISLIINDTLVNYYVDKKEELNNLQSNLALGDTVKIHGTYKIPDNNSNFNLFNYRLYLKSKKINYILTSDKIEKIEYNKNIFYSIKNIIINKIEKSKNKDYLYAFILGDTGDIDNNVTSSFQINGISHLFAISGMHVSLLSSIILFILNNFKKSNFNYILTIIFLFFYAFLANYSPSIMRSFFLFTFIFINKSLKLDLKNIYIFIYITCFFLIYNYYYIYNAGFLFSFVICFFLIIYGNISNGKSYFISLLITSLVASLSSIPIAINNYYSINLLSPLINLIFVPLISLVIFPLSLLTFILPFLSPILNICITILETLSIFISKYNISLTLCHIPLYIFLTYYLIIIFIFEMMKQNKYYFIILIYIVLIIHSNYKNMYDEIHMIDVGQGDSILIRLKNDINVLIDTGGIANYETEEWKKREYSLAKNITIPYLKSLGIKKLDYLIITHGDFDHIGESYYLINNFKVENVYMNSHHNNGSEIKLIDQLNSKKIHHFNINTYTLNVRNVKFSFINKEGISENNDSLVIFTNINNKNILLMGDADKVAEDYIMNEYNLPKMDILKIGHHGSKYSSSEKFLEYINPSYALISVGKKNKFNHPHIETLNKLNNLSIPYFMTSINGSVKLILKDKIDIYTCK